MSNEVKKACAAAVSRVLADTFVLYVKTHNFHWNVEGRDFRALHGLFEEQYRDLWESLDELAERIRALDEYAPGTMAGIASLATVTESNEVPAGHAMLKTLIADNEKVAETIRQSIQTVQEARDEPSAGLLTDRLARHEQQIWMMKSMLK